MTNDFISLEILKKQAITVSYLVLGANAKTNEQIGRRWPIVINMGKTLHNYIARLILCSTGNYVGVKFFCCMVKINIFR